MINSSQVSDNRPIWTEGLERILAFSDGVFAIAITLLVLDIRLPSEGVQWTNAEMLEQLAALGPKLYAYFLSFAVVAVFWVKHHATFRQIKAYDKRLLVLNFLLLLVVSFLPFPTAMMSAQANGVAAAFYALTMALGFLFSAWILRHVSLDQRLTGTDFDRRRNHQAFVSSLVAAAIFVAAAAIAMVNVNEGKLAMLLPIPAGRIRRLTSGGKA